MLFLALSRGEWEKAVPALRGWVVRFVPPEEQEEYRELIVQLNIQTPLGLEGEVVPLMGASSTSVGAAA